MQCLLLAMALPFTPGLCASAALAHPVAQQRTHSMFATIDIAAALPAMARPPSASSPTPSAECAVLLTWLRVSMAVLLPLQHEALTEAALWRAHQAERQQAGVPHGRAPALLVAVLRRGKWLMFWEEGGVHAALMTWLLLALAWHWLRLLLG